MEKRRVHFVLSTHWDREWHQPFQDFRYRLVQLLDRVLAGLQDGRLKGPFTTDGQALVMEDYLEIRPERRAAIERMVREGRLVVGPWYAMPDEFLVSGESLVRNLRMGRDLARSLGGMPSAAAFVCDIFGHNSQLPQIMAGFGIHGGLIWRGTNHIQSRHIRWRGADGTVMPCYRFGAVGYSSYAYSVRHAFEPDTPFEADQVAGDLDAYLDAEAAATEIDPILLFDGGDHQEWDQDVYGVLLARAGRPDVRFEIVHSSLDAYLAEMLPLADRIADEVCGELREPACHPVGVDQQWLIPGVLSSRVWIKQENARCQALLCHWAEPFSALADAALGRPNPDGFLNVAWRWLIKNHPHDSICGCSIDQVHEDMKFRFSQCRQIGEGLTREAARQLAAHVAGEPGDDELRVTVFNPLPQAFEGPAELTLQIPAGWPTFNEFFGFEPKPGFRVFDATGREVAYQRLGQEMARTKVRLAETRFPETYPTDDITVSLPLEIPPMGYTTLTVRAATPSEPTRYPAVPGLAIDERTLRNEHLTVRAEADGTLTLTDHDGGETYRNLLTFEDVADIGDGWYHGQASNDRVVLSSGAPAEIALLSDGPLVATLRVRQTLSVPASFDFAAMARSVERVSLVVESTVTLRRGARRVEVATHVENTACDHRLRVLFPSGARAAETYLADSPFDVVERPIALRADNHLYRELEVETKPQQSWTAVHAGGRGLAVVSTGLMESAVRDLPERPIALTLYRSTRRTVNTDGEPGGQLLGDLNFQYWLTPLSVVPDRAALCGLGQRLAAGLLTTQLRAADVRLARASAAADDLPAIDLPAEGGYLSVEGAAVLTSARRVGAGLEVRLFNPTEAASAVSLGRPDPALPGAGWRCARPVDFESRPVGETLSPDAGGRFGLTLGPKQIVTLRLER